MITIGQIVVTPFPYTDLSGQKLRPVLLLRPASLRFDDWLVCMVTSQLHQYEAEIDELLTPDCEDFKDSGLKAPSILRLSRLAVLDSSTLVGAIGSISNTRLVNIRQRLSEWIKVNPST